MSSDNVYVLFPISSESFVICSMVTGPQNVAVNGEGRPKKRLVLNAFVEMCMSSRSTQLSKNLYTVADNEQAPGIKAPASGSTPTIVLRISTQSSTGSTWPSN